MSDSYIKWTPQEWASVAKRAITTKATRSDMSWQQIAVVSQDEIDPDRRRSYFGKLSGLRPLFDILGLDEQGNPKPAPPPPETEPPPPPPKPDALRLCEVPIDLLITEIFNRASVFKADLDKLLVIDASLKAAMTAIEAKLELALKRVDEVEGQVLKSMEGMDQINATYAEIRKLAEESAAEKGNRPVNPGMDKALSRIAPMRVLLVGPHSKELPRIRERLPKHANIDLIAGDKQDLRLPTNVHYALVSGHHDFERHWQLVRDTYGPNRARRMENGALGTFANVLSELYAELP